MINKAFKISDFRKATLRAKEREINYKSLNYTLLQMLEAEHKLVPGKKL